VNGMSLDAKFLKKVLKTDSCWLWIGYVQPLGYGRLTRNDRQVLAHRWAYEVMYGPIPEGMEIDHKCRVRRCVNPEHLQAVTRVENCQNRAGAQSNSFSGVRGVVPVRDRWRVLVVSAGKQFWGGTYSTLNEAGEAASALRRRLMTNSLIDQHMM
jgi:hypothetical protein